ncbi:MAG: LptA/OstA family protein [Mariprofundaceae bacterium]|nr:LptA/OstA family protein [Mariprofundaceae bacterium]
MKKTHLRLNSLIVSALALLLILGTTAQAATVTIQSDHLDIWHDKQQALFVGNVHLIRDDFELFCDSLRAFYKSEKDGGGIDHALAIGHVRMLQGDKKGTADRAIIDNNKQIITLKGHATMQQADGRIEGDIIIHDMVRKTTEVRQGKNGRVRLRIDDKKAAPANTATEKKTDKQKKNEPQQEKLQKNKQSDSKPTENATTQSTRP